MKNPYDTHNLLSVLNAYSFWSLKTVNGNGRRRYECTIRAEEPGREYRSVYTATASTPTDAMRRAIEKVWDRKDRRPKGAPMLRLCKEDTHA